ncbi:MAG: methyltransferase [Planctomycetaceae bacterium]|nr:methyltransferase [Planctomycetaceae bacterium]
MQLDTVQANSHPRLSEFIDHVNGRPLLRGSAMNMELLHRKYGDSYLAFAEEMLTTADSLGFDSKGAYERYIMEYIRDLIRFQKNGVYSNGTFEEIRARIYDNDALMGETYLPGLLIAYGFTSLLHEKYKFFEQAFLPHIRSDMTGVEVGCGDGFFLWMLLRTLPNLRVHGIDISPSAIEFTRKLLTTRGFEEGKNFTLNLGNIGERTSFADGSQQWCILTEVIEHVGDRFFTMGEIARFMAPGGLLFLATVKDSNHMDHIWNPESPDEVAELIESYGFTVEDQLIYVVKEEFKGLKDDAIGLAFVARKGD